MKKYIRKLISILLLFVFVVLCVSDMSVYAKEDEDTDNIVRIGYYDGDTRFQNGFSDNERKSGYAYEYYQRISYLTGWRYEYVYGSKTEILEKLISGDVDIVAGVYKTELSENDVLFSKNDMGLAEKPCYFAVNKDREDLWKKLNETQDKLISSYPDFAVTLSQRYYEEEPRQQVLTESERKWLEDKGSLNVGYIRSNLPLSDQSEDGKPIGVVELLIDNLPLYLGIPCNAICFDDVRLMEQALVRGEIDIAFPIYSDPWVSEKKGFYQTDSFISDRVMIVYIGNYHDDMLNKIAISDTGVGYIYYISRYYPDAEIIRYDNKEQAYGAVVNGEADCMIGCSSVLQRFFAEHSEYDDYNIAYLDAYERFCIAVNTGNNKLVTILNKSIKRLDNVDITSTIIEYTNVNVEYNFAYFLKRYYIGVIAVLFTFFSILLFVFIKYRSKTKHFNMEQEKSRIALEDALEIANTASNAKSTFLSSMSHDIRTPMNGIIGMTAIAAAHVNEPSRVEDCLAKITASSKHLLALINEVLDMSKIESGEVFLNEKEFTLSSVIDEMITINQPQIDAKRHDMVVHVLNIEHENVIGDSMRLQQIFTNLVSNAIKYTPDGGEIEITLSEKHSNVNRMGYYEFIVRDNGIGMSEDFIPHIYETFARDDKNDIDTIQGTGLGMAITRNIVRMMNGEIHIDSKLGEGSTFKVTFYLRLNEEDSIPYEDFIDLNILVVDDDPIICESTTLLLSELGMNGESVMSGCEAIEKVKERHDMAKDYFAVLLDWKMPGMDGLETTRQIRKVVGGDVPIIIISAYDWSSIEEEAVKAGANGFIGKPLFKSRLTHLFADLLGYEKDENNAGLKELTDKVDFTGKRALMAEDNEMNAEIAIEILGMTGLEVEWAQDGKEAFDKFSDSEPGYYDCIFMDLQMPVMNGIDSAKAIRALTHADAKKIPIFAMTANVFAEDVQAVLNAGMNEHIAKPLDVNAILEMLKKYIG